MVKHLASVEVRLVLLDLGARSSAVFYPASRRTESCQGEGRRPLIDFYDAPAPRRPHDIELSLDDLGHVVERHDGLPAAVLSHGSRRPPAAGHMDIGREMIGRGTGITAGVTGCGAASRIPERPGGPRGLMTRGLMTRGHDTGTAGLRTSSAHAR